MTELTYTVPTTGEAVTVAEPLVDTALTELKTTVNGKVGTINLEAEAVTPAKTNKEILRTGALTEALAARAKATKFKVSATRPALVMLAITGGAGGVGKLAVTVTGTGVETYPQNVEKSGNATLTFPLLANEEWEWTSSGTEPTVKSTYLPL